jgi:hypothetical protein
VPTYERLARFDRDYAALSPDQQRAFRRALDRFVQDLQAGGPFRRGLLVKAVQRASGVFEMTWAPDGRATFHYGDPVRDGDVHVVWRRVGTHAVLDEA